MIILWDRIANREILVNRGVRSGSGCSTQNELCENVSQWMVFCYGTELMMLLLLSIRWTHIKHFFQLIFNVFSLVFFRGLFIGAVGWSKHYKLLMEIFGYAFYCFIFMLSYNLILVFPSFFAVDFILIDFWCSHHSIHFPGCNNSDL